MLYVYVDGESHYTRNVAKMKEKFGPDVDLSKVRTRTGVYVKHECVFFWDREYNSLYAPPQPFRMVYFAAYTGEHDNIHALSEYVRGVKGFEPQLIKEDKDIRKRRKEQLEEAKLIEKPKGVDIMLAARMIEDAAAGNYQHCVLFTSDADFLPVIRAVRRLGKYVFVCGFGDNINRELKYVPDHFINLGDLYNGDHYQLAK
jgi:uncharacterized LabA/DUF88 family protein